MIKAFQKWVWEDEARKERLETIFENNCAAAMKEHFEKSGIDIFADYRYYPNQLIFNKLRDALSHYLE